MYNQFNFGWIDVDCFILNSHILDDAAIFYDGCVCLNSVWSWESNFGLQYHNTYFVYINIEIGRLIYNTFNVKPGKYIYEVIEMKPYEYLELIDTEHIELLSGYIPLYQYPEVVKTYNRLPFFDTFLFYQTVALCLGCKGRKVYDLRSDDPS